MKNDLRVSNVNPSVETWNEEDFTPTTLDVIQPSETLDDGGKINYYHRLSMESGKVSIAAALMTALILTKKKAEYAGAFEEWLATNTGLSRMTAWRYMTILNQSIGKTMAADLAHDDAKIQLKAVAEFTAQTNYRSLYQIYHSAGIVKKSNLGGADRGQGRKRKLTDAELAAEAEALAADPVLAYHEITAALDAVEAFVVARDGLGLLEDARIEAVVSRLESFAGRGREILKARAKRAAK